MTITIDTPIPDSFVPLKNLPVRPTPFLWLFSLTSPLDEPIVDLEGNARVLQATANPAPVEFGTDDVGDPVVWSPWDVSFGALQATSDGSVSGLQLAIANPGGLLSELARENDWFARHVVRMILVHQDLLNDPAASWVTALRVVNVPTVSSEALTLSLALHDFDGVTIPTFLFGRLCRWRYRGFGCDFTGDPGNVELGQCTKSLNACRLRGLWELNNGLPVRHPRVYGGQRALPAGPFRTA